jgi:Zn-dependent metalloprotease
MKKTTTILFFFILLFSLRETMSAQNARKGALQEVLQNEYGATLSFHPGTGLVRFVQFPVAGLLSLTGTNAEEKAANFLYQFKGLWGLEDPANDLVFQYSKMDMAGNTHLSFRQEHRGLPVFDGELRFHFNRFLELKSVSGVVIPCRSLPTQAVVSPSWAVLYAKSFLQKEENTIYESLAEPTLMVFYRGLAQGVKGESHLAYEILLGNSETGDRQYVYIDALVGNPVERFPANCSALNRELYSGDTSGSPIWTEGDPPPSGTEELTLVDVSEHTYYLFFHAFGYDSYDGSGATMKTVVDATNVNCPNATWNGTSTNFCTGFGYDDIVGHEWAHAYTEYTSNLVYAWQPGAMNEAFSDIWGETIDLLNNYDLDTDEGTLRTGCNSSPRWLMGEGRGSALRDMWQPSCKGDPNAVDDANYWCSTGDVGGVHTNSGVPNHAYALLVDGGSYNGVTVAAIGFTKAAHIFWQAQSQYLTRTSDFAVLASALESSCTDLLGVNLPALGFSSTNPGLSGEMITAADCAAVADAIAAVAMTEEPDCGFEPLLDATTPDLCPMDNFQQLFFDDFESGFAGWTATENPTNPGSWDSRNWEISNALPGGRAGQGLFGADPVNGDCGTDLENGTIDLESPLISVPAGYTTTLYLTFDHYVATESTWDGGILQYEINDGGWQDVASEDFVFNAYNANLRSVGAGNDNPLAGKASFTGTDGGSVFGSWGTSQIELGMLPGDDIRLRWRLGTDGCNGNDGWYLDNVEVGVCQTIVLPVVWEMFTVKEEKQAALLEWTVSEESNNAGFRVERSSDANTDFVTVGWVAGAGNSDALKSYQYEDKTVVPGRSYYYRLRQVDVDGEESLSALRTFRMESNAVTLFELYPNPIKEKAQVRWLAPDADRVEVALYRLDGQLAIPTATYEQVVSGQRLILNLEKLPAGVYLLVAKTVQGEERKLVVKG